MPRSVTVTLQDGRAFTFDGVPDTATAEEVNAKAQEQFGSPVANSDFKQPSFGEEAARQGKLFLNNVMQGLAGFPGLVTDIMKTGAAKQGNDPARGLKLRQPDHQFGDTMKDIAGGAEAITGVKPETPAEKRVAAVTQGAIGALGPGAAAGPFRAAFAGATGGAGAQLANEVSDGDPLMTLLGGLAGGLTGGSIGNFAAGTRPQVKRIAREAGEGISDAQLRSAANFQRQAASDGINMDLAQALEGVGAPTGNLTTIRDVLFGHSAGNQVQQTIRNQPQQFGAVKDLTMLGLPGKVVSPTQAANDVQKAATQRLDQLKRFRSDQVRALYDQAGDITPAQRDQLIATVKGLANEPGAPTALKTEARTFARKLLGIDGKAGEQFDALSQAVDNAVTPDARLAAQQALGKFEREMAASGKGVRGVHAKDVDTAISELIGPYKGSPLNPANPSTLGAMKNAAKKLNEQFKTMSPEIRKAEERFAQLSRDVVNPAKQSVLGRMSGAKGYLDTQEAAASKLKSLFSEGSDPAVGSINDITKLASELNRVDRTSFPNAAKTYISGRMADAFGPELNNVPDNSRQAAEAVWNSLFKSQKHMAGMRQMLAGIADAHGLERREVVRGMETLAQYAKALRNTPRGEGGLTAQELKELGGSNRLANITRIYGFLPFERVARKLEDAQLAATFGRFDEILTSPEGAQLLTQIGRRSVMDPEIANILMGFKGGAQIGANPPGSTGE